MPFYESLPEWSSVKRSCSCAHQMSSLLMKAILDEITLIQVLQLPLLRLPIPLRPVRHQVLSLHPAIMARPLMLDSANNAALRLLC